MTPLAKSRSWFAALILIPLAALVAPRNCSLARSSPPVVTILSKPKTTVGVFDRDTGTFLLRNWNTSGFADRIVNFGRPGDLPVIGDWDGDGVSTPGVYRRSTDQFLLRNALASGAPDLVVTAPFRGEVPLAGRWSGKGVWRVGLYRRGDALFALNLSDGWFEFRFGEPGDIPVAGDWNGDGVGTLGVFRPSSRKFLLTNNPRPGQPEITFSISGVPPDARCVPIAGDWNGNQMDSVGLVCGGQFFLKYSNRDGEADRIFAFGTERHLPLAGSWGGQ